ncbi:MAG: Spy0128 family protein [Brotaphodocola sp.]
MRKIKKIMATVLAATMVMSMGMTAWAVDGESNEEIEGTQTENPYEALEDDGVRILKTYEVKNGTAPQETFNFTFTFQGYKNNEGTETTLTNDQIPNISSAALNTATDIVKKDNVAVSVSESTYPTELTAGTYTLEKFVQVTNLSDCPIGTYTYQVNEQSGNNAGVTYGTNETLYLVMTIYRDNTNGKHYISAIHYDTESGTKTGDGFNNAYDANALKVEKYIAGNLADMTKKFTFTVVFEDTNNIAADLIELKLNGTSLTDDSLSQYEVTKAKDDSNKKVTYTFKLTNDNSFEFTNVPVGVSYSISEDQGQYVSTVDKSNADTATIEETNFPESDKRSDTKKTVNGTINTTSDVVKYTNTLKNENIDTGIILDSAPYVLLLALAGLGAFAVVSKKREEEF